MGTQQMRMSDRGVELLTLWEGFRDKTYIDSAGHPTIGVGHMLTTAELKEGLIIIQDQPVAYNEGLSYQQVCDLLAQDLASREAAVNNCVTVPLQQHQFDALVSFVFNVGAAAFEKSTLLWQLNEERYNTVPDQLRRWVKANGKQIQGLVNRREKEIKLWNGPLALPNSKA